jgi:hypothetical protein
MSRVWIEQAERARTPLRRGAENPQQSTREGSCWIASAFFGEAIGEDEGDA